MKKKINLYTHKANGVDFYQKTFRKKRRHSDHGINDIE